MRKQTVKKINIEDANIKTATVEIKSLVISARKMTLSVFRQIQEEKIIDLDSLQLRGVPWGTINYFWGGDNAELHVLWQKGAELRRALVRRYWVYLFENEWNYKEYLDRFSSDCHKGWRGKYRKHIIGEIISDGKRHNNDLITEESSDDEVIEYLKTAFVNYSAYKAKHDALVDNLSQLDQLFIAV